MGLELYSGSGQISGKQRYLRTQGRSARSHRQPGQQPAEKHRHQGKKNLLCGHWGRLTCILEFANSEGKEKVKIVRINSQVDDRLTRIKYGAGRSPSEFIRP